MAFIEPSDAKVCATDDPQDAHQTLVAGGGVLKGFAAAFDGSERAMDVGCDQRLQALDRKDWCGIIAAAKRDKGGGDRLRARDRAVDAGTGMVG